MKAGYRESSGCSRSRPRRRRLGRARRLRDETFDWQARRRRATRCPSVLELQERFGGRRVLITGGGGSIGGALAHAARRLPAREASRCSTATRHR